MKHVDTVKHVGIDVATRIAEQEELGGIHVSSLNPGTVVEFTTRNSTYRIEILEGNSVEIQGGKRFEVPTKAILVGSTWGTSILKAGWIGKDMKVELVYQPEGMPYKTILTSYVRDAKIIFSDGVIVPMQWEDQACDA